MHKALIIIFFIFAFLVVSPIGNAAARGISQGEDSASLGYDARMIQAADIAESNARKHSIRRCWRAVKNALLKADVIPHRPTTRYAKQAGQELQTKFGFKKLEVQNPFDAPVGAVLVYGGRGPGHVEIRTKDGFVSDFVTPHPSTRPLLGVYVKV